MANEVKEKIDNDLGLANEFLARIKDADNPPAAVEQDTGTIYDIEEFWIVRDRPPYFV